MGWGRASLDSRRPPQSALLAESMSRPSFDIGLRPDNTKKPFFKKTPSPEKAKHSFGPRSLAAINLLGPETGGQSRTQEIDGSRRSFSAFRTDRDSDIFGCCGDYDDDEVNRILADLPDFRSRDAQPSASHSNFMAASGSRQKANLEQSRKSSQAHGMDTVVGAIVARRPQSISIQSSGSVPRHPLRAGEAEDAQQKTEIQFVKESVRNRPNEVDTTQTAASTLNLPARKVDFAKDVQMLGDIEKKPTTSSSMKSAISSRTREARTSKSVSSHLRSRSLGSSCCDAYSQLASSPLSTDRHAKTISQKFSSPASSSQPYQTLLADTRPTSTARGHDLIDSARAKSQLCNATVRSGAYESCDPRQLHQEERLPSKQLAFLPVASSRVPSPRSASSPMAKRPTARMRARANSKTSIMDATRDAETILRKMIEEFAAGEEPQAVPMQLVVPKRTAKKHGSVSSGSTQSTTSTATTRCSDLFEVRESSRRSSGTYEHFPEEHDLDAPIRKNCEEFKADADCVQPAQADDHVQSRYGTPVPVCESGEPSRRIPGSYTSNKNTATITLQEVLANPRLLFSPKETFFDAVEFFEQAVHDPGSTPQSERWNIFGFAL